MGTLSIKNSLYLQITKCEVFLMEVSKETAPFLLYARSTATSGYHNNTEDDLIISFVMVCGKVINFLIIVYLLVYSTGKNAQSN